MRTADTTVRVDEHQGGSVVITVEGELDVHTRLHLARALGRHEHRQVHLDLSGVTFADSAALAAILSANRAATRAGGSVEVVAVSPTVRRLLRLINGGGPMLKRLAS